ncbi:unnamed protein product [Closterium sp. Naga37s-1]|nr:unnamed protein product [Closterium sp. Naga37s-1]
MGMMICGPATIAAMTLEEAINQANSAAIERSRRDYHRARSHIQRGAHGVARQKNPSFPTPLSLSLPPLFRPTSHTVPRPHPPPPLLSPLTSSPAPLPPSPSLLPALSGAAKLTITGACGSRSGGDAFPIFTSSLSSGSTARQLTLVNLSFQQADKFPIMDTPPKRLFADCIFFNSTAPMGGGAVNIDALTFDAFGLTDRVPALTFLRYASGGAVYSKDAALTFVNTNLFSNKARGTAAVNGVTSGTGGAVYAAASGTNTDAALRFCSTTSFKYKGASVFDGANLYMEVGVVGSRWAAALAFCGCSKPSGSVVPTSGWQLLTSCSAR